jgi:hypothetical protein
VKKVRGELKGAVLGGLTAALAREARHYLTGASGGMLDSVLHQGGDQPAPGSGQMHREPSHRERL